MIPAAAERGLIPLERPTPGRQYAFEIDLDACSGCKSCVTACHSLNGLDGDEAWRSVGLLFGATAGLPVLQPVTAACHHCVDPGCMAGCPVAAYEKDPVTGIVRHLDDQCIGCGYCLWTCPYEVPRFDALRGIVRKCDLCSGRLDAGEAPACVQACPTEAIRVTLVDTAAVVADARGGSGGAWLPTAPPPHLTVPTTRYVTARELPADVLAADHPAARPGHPHPPLVVMLVLTQLAVGTFAVGAHAALALMAGLVALGASLLHLGRPLYAFRALVGIRTSWLSREIAAFTMFAPLAGVYALTGAPALRAAGTLVGVLAVGCSVMVYAVTGRTWWRAGATTVRFAGTATVCGLAVAAVQGAPVAAPLVVACAAKLAWETWTLREVRLMRRELRRPIAWRFGLGIAGGLAALAVPGLGLVVLVAGELLERALFFAACPAPRMPGALP